jgi:hypothetical protein
MTAQAAEVVERNKKKTDTLMTVKDLSRALEVAGLAFPKVPPHRRRNNGQRAEVHIDDQNLLISHNRDSQRY